MQKYRMFGISAVVIGWIGECGGEGGSDTPPFEFGSSICLALSMRNVRGHLRGHGLPQAIT